MAQVELTVCDICERTDRGTEHYFIVAGDGRKGEADLCEEHGKPIEHLLGDPRERDPLPAPSARKVAVKKAAPRKAATRKVTTKTTRSRQSLGAKVVSLDDIEAMKK